MAPPTAPFSLEFIYTPLIVKSCNSRSRCRSVDVCHLVLTLVELYRLQTVGCRPHRVRLLWLLNRIELLTSRRKCIRHTLCVFFAESVRSQVENIVGEHW